MPVTSNVVSNHIISEDWCLRSLKTPPIFLSHHDVPLVSTKMPVFNDIDSPSLFLLVSDLGARGVLVTPATCIT